MIASTPMFLRKILPLVAVGFLFAACDDATAPIENARVEIRLTDNPSEILATAEVTISAVYLQGGPDDDDATGTDESDDADEPSGRTYLYEAVEGEEPFTVNLLELQNGVSVGLAGAEVEPGSYGQLRFVVGGSVVTLSEGYTFEDGSTEREIRIPSGSTSGIKVNLTNDIEAPPGETLELLVDFDVNEAFRFP
ncbi:MAG TPA: DUF4382 domain-containing protein, partial [Longimicrobiales bacterium]|nr:DUF4382 domain-containing protein [Longimicrobiales bacterium]